MDRAIASQFFTKNSYFEKFIVPFSLIEYGSDTNFGRSIQFAQIL